MICLKEKQPQQKKTSDILHTTSRNQLKMTPRDPKSEKLKPRDDKMKPKVPKGSPRKPKGCPKGAQGSQKRAKGQPKCITKSIFGKGREKKRQKLTAYTVSRTILATIFYQKSKKWHPKRHPKIDAEKVSGINANMMPK